MKKMLAGLFLLLLFAAPGFAQCGPPHCAAQIPTVPVSGSIASSNLGAASFRVEARLFGQNWSAGANANIFSVGGYGAVFLGGSGIVNALFFSGADTTDIGFGNCDIVLGSSPPTDMIVRVDRDFANSAIRAEVFNTLTGAQIGTTCTYRITASANSSAIKSSGVVLGDTRAGALGGNIAFLRWYNSSVPAGTPPTVGIAAPAALGDWEFQNNLNDTSGKGQKLSGNALYVDTPIYNPACVIGASQAVQIGGTMSLNGSGSNPLDGGTTLTYAWTYFAGSDGVNQNATLAGANTATPVASGLNQFGSADFQLVVTDSSGNSSACSVHNGVVITDGNGVINLTSEGLDPVSQKFLGPIIKYGANTWPWADTMHKTEMDLQINNLANYYTPFWRIAQPGTISVTAGSTIITGAGTDLTAPCGGGSAPLTGAAIFLIYPGTDGLTHYLPAQVLSCTDASHIVMQMPQGGTASNGYPTGSPPAHTPWPDCSSGCSGWAWSWGYYGDTIHSPQYQYGNWIYNAAPGNYYDNAKAFYALYWRSGIDTYLATFQNLADEWWEFPIMDQGFECNAAGSSCWAPAAWRSMALNGVVLRALEEGSGSTKWSGLWIVAQLAQAYMADVAALTPPLSIDARESGYAMSMLAYCAIADPNPNHRSSCQATIKGSLATVWAKFRRPDIGVWGQFEYANQVPANQASSISVLGGAGSACVVNGNTTVTGTGTNWTSAANGFEIWFFAGNPAVPPVTNAAGDSAGYGITVNSATSLTLTSPYAGATSCTGVSGSNSGYVLAYQEGGTTPDPTNGLAAWGVFPYMEGLLGTGFGWDAIAMDGYDAASAALYRSYLDSIVQWLIIYGMNTSQGGLYSGSMFVGCVPPIPTTNVSCNGGSQSGSRTLSLDVMRAFAMDYQNTGSPVVRAAADTLMSQMFSKPGTGGPNPDGYYISDFDGTFISGMPPIGSAPKWAGQLCGFEEACDMWPAVRIVGAVAWNPLKITGGVVASGKASLP